MMVIVLMSAVVMVVQEVHEEEEKEPELVKTQWEQIIIFLRAVVVVKAGVRKVQYTMMTAHCLGVVFF
jgi:hypothetical protein